MWQSLVMIGRQTAGEKKKKRIETTLAKYNDASSASYHCRAA